MKFSGIITTNLRQIDMPKRIIYTVVMVRAIIKPETSRINLPIPNEYIGEEVEILIFPVNSAANYQESVDTTEEQRTRRLGAYHNFMKYKGSLSADFDYKKELAEYRDERYGNPN